MKAYIQILGKFLIDNVVFICAFIIYILLSYIFHFVNCPIKLCIGYPCPGCGMTRACLSIFRFDFKSAFHYNPFVFLLPFLLWIVIFRQRPWISKIYNNTFFWIIILVLVVVVYVLRLLYVYPNVPMDYYSENILNKIIQFVKKIRG